MYKLGAVSRNPADCPRRRIRRETPCRNHKDNALMKCWHTRFTASHCHSWYSQIQPSNSQHFDHFQKNVFVGSPKAAAGIKLTIVRTARVRGTVGWKQRPHGSKARLSKKQAVKSLSGKEQEQEVKKAKVRMVHMPLKPSKNNGKLVVAVQTFLRARVGLRKAKKRTTKAIAKGKNLICGFWKRKRREKSGNDDLLA